MIKITGITILIMLLCGSEFIAQSVPAKIENIPFLVTFSKEAKSSYGDDDQVQTFFFTVPKSFTKPFYIRVFDPDIGGKNDEIISDEDSETLFSLYGGETCITEQDAREVNPVGKYKSGNLLFSKSFGNEDKYDGKWYSFGPINPSQGEFSEEYYGYVFKLICEGGKGNDGNLYKYYMSTSGTTNISVPGGNAFTFEYSFRLHSDVKQVAHIYPFVDDKVVSVKQTNFDYDSEGSIKIYSVATIGQEMKVSGDDEFVHSKYIIKEKEKGTSLEIQFQRSNKNINNNNVVFHVTNQYGQALPSYTIPIGGVPKYKGKIIAKPIDL
ncbi:MAG: hypothetical protein ACI9N1_001240 [Flavobacteriales bacterium]|jgi:hypothetical protein